jgi:hypothetical protein
MNILKWAFSESGYSFKKKTKAKSFFIDILKEVGVF